MYKISVITAVLNGEEFIRKTLESVLAQKGTFELEYIIRDGCSSDKTLEILEDYKDKIILYSQKDGSPQEAINAGISVASGDIVCWLNADDVFEENSLQLVVDAFEKNPNKNWLYGKCSIIDNNGKEIRKAITYYKNLLGYFYSKNILLCENFISQPATFWRKDFWKTSCNLNTQFKAAWDYELWVNMALQSSPIHLRTYLAKFRRHASSISENYFVKQFTEELAVVKKHGNALHYSIHKLNQLKIIWIYKILASRS